MPRVPYYLGRPARIWIAAMSRRGSARQTREDSGLAVSDIPGQPQSVSPTPRRRTLQPESNPEITAKQ
jgi:hypothetical protein